MARKRNLKSFIPGLASLLVLHLSYVTLGKLLDVYGLSCFLVFVCLFQIIIVPKGCAMANQSVETMNEKPLAARL